METVAQLITALKNNDWTVRANAAEVSGKARNSAAVPFLTDALKDESNYVRCLTALALGNIGDAAADALEEVARRPHS